MFSMVERRLDFTNSRLFNSMHSGTHYWTGCFSSKAGLWKQELSYSGKYIFHSYTYNPNLKYLPLFVAKTAH